jgi:hypothetical protein
MTDANHFRLVVPTAQQQQQQQQHYDSARNKYVLCSGWAGYCSVLLWLWQRVEVTPWHWWNHVTDLVECSK